jgi:hypothetical protein
MSDHTGDIESDYYSESEGDFYGDQYQSDAEGNLDDLEPKEVFDFVLDDLNYEFPKIWFRIAVKHELIQVAMHPNRIQKKLDLCGSVEALIECL